MSDHSKTSAGTVSNAMRQFRFMSKRPLPPVAQDAVIRRWAHMRGISLVWHGRVFLNPPYGRDIIRWIEKAHTSVSERHAQSVLALVPDLFGRRELAYDQRLDDVVRRDRRCEL